MTTEYSIWVLEYAYIPEYPVSGFIYGAHNSGVRRMPFAYVVLVGGGRVGMIDVGFGATARKREIAEQYGIEAWQDPAVVLAEVGMTPADVDTVLVTHAHYDHFGNSRAFPKATFYLQERELVGWTVALALPAHLRVFNQSIDNADILGALELAAEGRLRLLTGPSENVLPGVNVVPAFDTHTYGSMFVTVEDGKGGGRLVFAGDNLFTWEQLPSLAADGLMHAPGLAMSNWNSLLVCDEMLRSAGGEPYRIIPVHEAQLPAKYPSRVTKHGLSVTEIRLAAGAVSRV
jgi:glyoxylase-like metal-dependent hydrolase (beta-lactamase superfamily II)